MCKMTSNEIQDAVLAITALRPAPIVKTTPKQSRLIDIKKRQDERAFAQELAEIENAYRHA